MVESSDSEKPFASPKKRPARRKKRKNDDIANVSAEDVAVSAVRALDLGGRSNLIRLVTFCNPERRGIAK